MVKSKKFNKGYFGRNLRYTGMAFPGIFAMILWCYIPMVGLLLAFKNYSYAKGFFGSPWVGFRNFKFFFTSNNFWILMRNTVGYNLLFLCLTTIVLSSLMAILLYEVQNKVAAKIYHTAMILPNFISFVIVGYIILSFLNPTSGIMNQVLTSLGFEAVDWYSYPKYWPFILTIVEVWKNIGMASLYYYGTLISVDTSLFEAAALDGAGRAKQIWHISVPEMLPMICITTIVRLGNILGGDWGLYYQIPMNQPSLYPTTDVFSTYIYRGLANGTISQTTATGMFKSVAGLILILIANTVIKRIDSDKAVF